MLCFIAIGSFLLNITPAIVTPPAPCPIDALVFKRSCDARRFCELARLLFGAECRSEEGVFVAGMVDLTDFELLAVVACRPLEAERALFEVLV